LKFELVKHWTLILVKSWSSIFAILSAILGTLDLVLNYLTSFSDNHWLGVAATVAAGLSAFARIVIQWDLRAEIKQRDDEDAYGYGKSDERQDI
jgi:hypothetical protein